jgi:hypothetical protein
MSEREDLSDDLSDGARGAEAEARRAKADHQVLTALVVLFAGSIALFVPVIWLLRTLG